MDIEKINYTEDDFKEINFKELVNIEIYSDRDIKKDGSRLEGFNIIKNNDMMQYHYFGQEYDIVQASPYLAVFNIVRNGIKHYIGFIALRTPSLNKTLRNMYFCPNFLSNLYKKDKYELYVIARMVILPSFRGMGLAKFLIDKLSDTIKDYIDYIEISSILLNTVDFIPNSFNKTFLKLEKNKRRKLFDILKKQSGKAKGFKEGAGDLANYAFKILNKEKLKKLYIEILYEIYNIENVNLNLDNIEEFFNETLYDNKFTEEELLYFRHNQLPLILLHNNDIEDIKKLQYNKGE